jgi:hypothetical protein
MAISGKATLHGLFSLKEDVTLEAFLPSISLLSGVTTKNDGM